MFERVYVCVAMPCSDPHVMSKAGMFVCVCVSMYGARRRVYGCGWVLRFKTALASSKHRRRSPPRVVRVRCVHWP